LNTENLLLFLKQDPLIAEYAGKYTKYLIPGLCFVYWFEAIRRYLLMQEIMRPLMWMSITSIPINALANYILIYTLGLGFIGSPIANSITSFSNFILVLIYMKFRKVGVNTWPGWNKNCLKGWAEFLKLGIPGTFMICLEWCAFEVNAFFCGYLGDVALATQAIVMSSMVFSFMFPLGIAVSSSTRVGNMLGANRWRIAKLAGKLAIASTIFFTSINALLLFIFRYQWGRLFTNDTEVIDTLVSIIPLISVIMLLDGQQGSISGILRGCGRQSLGAWVNLLCYWLIALPSGAFFAFYLHLGILGLWIGMLIGLLCIVTVFLMSIKRMDWIKQAAQAVALASQHLVPNEELNEEKSTANISMEDVVITENKDSI